MRLYSCALSLWLTFSLFEYTAVAFVSTTTTTTQRGGRRVASSFSSNHPNTACLSSCSISTSTTSLWSGPDGSIYPEGGTNPCIIRVIGVGGGGGNAVDRMLDVGMKDVDFWSINTDAQALGRSKAKGAKILTIGSKGLGAGGAAEVGRGAAEEARNEIASIVREANLCFVTAGMGGGTGSGAAPVVAEIAKEAGCLTVGIVTTPFSFEGKKRMETAKAAIVEMRKNVDAIIVISNTKLLELIPEETPMSDAFLIADDILREGVAGISDIITNPGIINIDFADVKSVLDNAGTALMGVGVASGKDAASQAAQRAVECPLLDSKTIEDATGILMNISGGSKMSLQEVMEASEEVRKITALNANIIVGTSEHQDTEREGDISITVVATGFKIDGECTSGIHTETIKKEKVEANNNNSNNNSNSNSKQQQQGRLSDVMRSSSSSTISRSSSPQQQTTYEPAAEEISNDNNGGGGGDFPNFLRSLKRKR